MKCHRETCVFLSYPGESHKTTLHKRCIKQAQKCIASKQIETPVFWVFLNLWCSDFFQKKNDNRISLFTARTCAKRRAR
ncbi:hypothetical protein A8L51_06030 [Pantoea stewartii]|nr:hypothetical protein [Pantoea stewartii]